MLQSFRVMYLIAALVLAGACAEPAGDGGNEIAVGGEGAPATSRLAGLLGSSATDGYALALEPIRFEFPEDHGAHPAFRNEWWYVTGNLDAANGDRFGFELTLFRFSLSPDPLGDDSAWRTDQVYIGHFAVTDAAAQRFYAAQRYSRGALGLAGTEQAPFRVWLEDWSLEATGGQEPHGMPWRLRAADQDMAVDLLLDSKKATVLNGDAGLSQKSAVPGNASYYYSMTRLRTNGSIRTGDREFDVSGLAWLDREWSSSALGADQAGWDWFALQFDDQTELMFYRLRKLDGSADRFSAGTFVRADGTTTRLDVADVELDVTDYWENELGDRYPVAWRMRLPSIGAEIAITPVLEDQELDTTVRYWEGAVNASRRGPDGTVDGRGYVELTGYSE